MESPSIRTPRRAIGQALKDLQPIRRETVMETVGRRIEDLVRSGDLRAGDRLPPEPELAQMLNVSRSSLREALKGLHCLGLIRSRPGSGTYIESSLGSVLNQHFQWMLLFEEVQHMEIYELRRIIEPEAAALSARRATRTDLDRMQRALEGMKKDLHSPELFHIHDIEFHEAFMQASGNAAIQATMRMLYHSSADARLRVLPFIQDMDKHYLRHERIYRHIYNREPALARKAVLDDLLYAESLLREKLKLSADQAPAHTLAVTVVPKAQAAGARKKRANTKK